MSEAKKPTVHPYIPNSAPQTSAEMLDFVGAKSVDELFTAIPESLRINGKLDLPPPFASECELKRHVSGLLRKNVSCEEYVSFLGGGVAHHHVPAVCDELISRAEFLTSYLGNVWIDHGRFQVLWEFQSLIGDLLEMDVVGEPTYCGSSAAYSALLLASRVAGRKQALVPRNISRDRLALIKEVCRAQLDITEVAYDQRTGLLDLGDLEAKISDQTAVVYFENPTYLGSIEPRGNEIAKIAHENGALCAVSVNPISLGLLETPRNYGADIVCGEMQPLGIHMQYGGGMGGFLAVPDEERFIAEYPFRLFGRTDTVVEGELGFGVGNYEHTSYVRRDLARDFIGTNASLFAVAVGAYLSLMGPQGMREVGETIVGRTHYAVRQLASIEGIRIPLEATPFMEFVVNFDQTGNSVREINKRLLDRRIFGGKDISNEFPELGQSALYCVTEVTTKENIDSLVDALREIVA